MKKVVFLFWLSICLNIVAYSQSNFNKGYSKGFEEGYCQDKGIKCVKPLSPIPPIPTVYENVTSFKDGYNRGFKDGLAKQQSDEINKQNYKTSKSIYVDKKIQNPLKDVDVTNIILLSRALKESKDLALKYLEYKNYQAVAEICYSGLRVNPKDHEFMLLLGQAFRYSGDMKNAYKWLKRASSRRPKDKNLKKLVKEIKASLK